MLGFKETVINSLHSLEILDISLLAINGVMLLFSRLILKKLTGKEGSSEAFNHQLRVFRVFSALIVSFVLFEDFFLPVAFHSWLTRIIAAPLVIFIIYMLFYVINYFIKKKFGLSRVVNNKTVISETYNSRILSLLTAIFMLVFGLIAVIQLMGFDNLLKAGGVVGFVGVMLALTQGAWAPDIISGLILLNSGQLDAGDVVQFNDSKKTVGVVFRVKLFYTEVLSLANNHRIMLKNSKLREHTIHNLSKFSSPKGLREQLSFNIGYDVKQSHIENMFESAYEKACSDADIHLEKNHPIEVMAMTAGDFAVKWSLFYYTKDVRMLLRTRQLFLGIILKEAAACGVTLATPMKLDMTRVVKNSLPMTNHVSNERSSDHQ